MTELTKKEFWDAMVHPHDVFRSCWNCLHFKHFNSGSCGKQNTKKAVRDKCKQSSNKKKKHWEWNDEY